MQLQLFLFILYFSGHQRVSIDRTLFSESRPLFMHPSTLCALLKHVIDADGGETTAKPQGDGYRIAGIRVHTSTAVTESKIVLADVPTIHIVRYGPAMLLVDPFSAGRSTTGETQIVIQNYVDTIIPDRNLVVVGSA